MRVMLTSCGLETKQIENAFTCMLGKDTKLSKALFITAAAVDPGAVMVLPKCLNDLLKVGIPEANITVCDLHVKLTDDELKKYDVVYLCGGRTQYLLDRINDTGFDNVLKRYIAEDGFVIGVSAGSLVFTNNLKDNLGLLDTRMNVHCEKGAAPGKLAFPLPEVINLSNTGAILLRDIPDDCELIDG